VSSDAGLKLELEADLQPFLSLSLSAMAMMSYALFRYHQRANAIRKKAQAYDDRVGPVSSPSFPSHLFFSFFSSVLMARDSLRTASSSVLIELTFAFSAFTQTDYSLRCSYQYVALRFQPLSLITFATRADPLFSSPRQSRL